MPTALVPNRPLHSARRWPPESGESNPKNPESGTVRVQRARPTTRWSCDTSRPLRSSVQAGRCDESRPITSNALWMVRIPAAPTSISAPPTRRNAEPPSTALRADRIPVLWLRLELALSDLSAVPQRDQPIPNTFVARCGVGRRRERFRPRSSRACCLSSWR
jgi:hypothetical protein